MKTARKVTWLMIYLLLLAALSGEMSAQGPRQVRPPECHRVSLTAETAGASEKEDRFQREDEWMPASSRPPSGLATSTQATGSPDHFGYTWDDSVPLDWVDATTGIDAGLSGYSRDQATGPVSLPFPFKYYENTYTHVRIVASGYLAFSEASSWPTQGQIPSPAPPNDIVAPYWTPFELASSGTIGRIFYSSGGSTPDRYFVVQWNAVSYGNEGPHTFQVILHENGDIVFQYETMTYDTSGYWCASAGIEDATGLDGLTYVDFCGRIWDDHKAVRFYRPAPSARVSIRPLHQGRFVRAGDTAVFEIPIRNSGDLGSDTYDVLSSSTWPVSLYHADGVTPLTDTDGDGVADTGPVPQGAAATIVAEVTVPGSLQVGDSNEVAIAVSSSLDSDKRETASLQTGVPAPFAQAYSDQVDGAMSLGLIRPTAEQTKKITADGHYGSSPAVATAPNGNLAYAWTKWGAYDSYVREIEYALVTPCGVVRRPVSKLTDHSSATINTYDNAPALAVAPDGRIGVAWYRYLYNSSDYTWNYNIYYAVLDASGDMIVPAQNVTNNPLWGYG